MGVVASNNTKRLELGRGWRNALADRTPPPRAPPPAAPRTGVEGPPRAQLCTVRGARRRESEIQATRVPLPDLRPAMHQPAFMLGPHGWVVPTKGGASEHESEL